jgi:hypothetical protein
MVDPITVTLTLFGLVLGTAATTSMWNQILQWAESNLFPWIEQNLPMLTDTARMAFSIIDDHQVAIRRAIKAAWTELRRYLLKQTVELVKQSSSKWIREVTSWVIENLEQPQPVVKKVCTVEEISWYDLPDDVRQSAIRYQKTTLSENVTQQRDRLLEDIN